MTTAPVPSIADDQIAELTERHGVPAEALQVLQHVAGLYSGGAIKGDPTQLFITGHQVWMARQALEKLAALAQQPAAAGPACLAFFTETKFSQLPVFEDGRTPLYLTEEQFNAIRSLAATEQPDIVPVPAETLRRIHLALDSCQKVIWLAGCRPRGYGFDPAYVSNAQERMKEIDALLAGGAA